MRIILAVAAGLILVAVILRILLKTPPAKLARRLKIVGGVTLLILAGGLLILGQVGLALPAGFAGFFLLRQQAGMRQAGPSGARSNVRSAGLEMELDHDTGELDGRVLAGRHAGRMLSDLQMDQLLDVAADLRSDAGSLRLLESYLDRTQPDWRDNLNADHTERQSASARASGMDTKEAYQILGLEPGAGETEVREAHRRLMKQVHPDRGGSAALAAKINEAKDRILGKHR